MFLQLKLYLHMACRYYVKWLTHSWFIFLAGFSHLEVACYLEVATILIHHDSQIVADVCWQKPKCVLVCLVLILILILILVASSILNLSNYLDRMLTFLIR